jgi:hypothetical protein
MKTNGHGISVGSGDGITFLAPEELGTDAVFMHLDICDPACRQALGRGLNALREADGELAKLIAIRDTAEAIEPFNEQDPIDHLSNVAIDIYRLNPDLVTGAIGQGMRRARERRAGELNGKANGADPKSFGISAAELQRMTFPPTRYILPGIIPQGLTLLVSRPKLGKSWLALDLCIAVATGRATLGELRPDVGDVLHISLEDGLQRLQRRMTKLLPTFTGEWPTRLTISTEWLRANEGGLKQIEDWCASVAEPRLVVIDVLARFRPQQTDKTIYSQDYEAIAALQKIASKFNIAIVIIHHDRKADADDPFDTVSGSLGITGAADTILVMKRHAGGATLYVRGRDIEEAEKALQWNRVTCRWTILGEATEVHRSQERGAILAVLAEASEPLTVPDIMAATGFSRNATDLLLGKMAREGEVTRVGRGRYAIPTTTGQKGQKERSDSYPTDIENENDDLSDLSDLSGGAA